MKSSDFQFDQQRTMLVIGGLVVLALVGIGMIWMGFRLDNGGRSNDQPSPTATSALPGVQPPAGGAVVPTLAPPPTATPPPPPPPSTDTPQPTPVPEPMIVAQDGGVNLRSGPGTNFSVVGRLEGGASAKVTGKYADWWQVDYGGTPAWVANWVVTDSNTEGVADVAPPASPIPPTRVPSTAVPPTAAPPTAIPPTAKPDTRGIVADSFIVGNKQDDGTINPNNKFGNAGDIWFYMQITNTSGGGVTIVQWGGFIEETGHFQKSWGGSGGGKPLELEPNKSKQWDDHFYNEEAKLDVGTYHIWMRVCFQDGYCVNIAGPVQVTIG